jgi:hypothetical protein
MWAFQRTFICVIFSSVFVGSFADVLNATTWNSLVQKYVVLGKTLEGIPLNEVDYLGLSQDPRMFTHFPFDFKCEN